MALVVTLFGFLPPPREDGVPWSTVQILESATFDGAYNLIDVQTLSPLDSNPAAPQLRNFTTTEATLTQGWYEVVFLDIHGGESEPSEPVPNPNALVLPPTADAVRNGSPLLRRKFPLPPVDPYAINDLANLVKQASAQVQSLTWRLIDPTLGDLAAEGYTSEEVPVGMVPLAVQAVTRMAERIKVTTDPAFAEQVATGRRLRGFSAGPYSESYFAPGEFARRGAQQGRPAMDPDDALDTALWALATEDARDYFVWRSTGVAAPAGEVTTFDYRRQTLGYGAGSIGFPGGYGRGGPDGF